MFKIYFSTKKAVHAGQEELKNLDAKIYKYEKKMEHEELSRKEETELRSLYRKQDKAKSFYASALKNLKIKNLEEGK